MTAILILGLSITNPNSQKYRAYAQEKISKELKNYTCVQLDKKSSSQLVNACQILVTSIQPQIELTIKQNTKYSNWIIFSIYTTKLEVSQLIPTYCFTTIGIFDFFVTYNIEEV